MITLLSQFQAMQAEATRFLTSEIDESAFINSILKMLDGPEQRAAFDAEVCNQALLSEAFRVKRAFDEGHFPANSIHGIDIQSAFIKAFGAADLGSQQLLREVQAQAVYEFADCLASEFQCGMSGGDVYGFAKKYKDALRKGGEE